MLLRLITQNSMGKTLDGGSVIGGAGRFKCWLSTANVTTFRIGLIMCAGTGSSEGRV